MESNVKKIAKFKKKYSKQSLNNNIFKSKSLVLTYLPSAFSVWILRHVLIKSDYKLKRESIKFFHLSNRAYGARGLRKCCRLLSVAIQLLGSNFPQNFELLLNNAVSVTFKNSKCRSSLSDSIFDATKEIDVMVFDATSWYQLSRGLFSLGYFRAAWVARENSIERSVLEAAMKNASTTALLRGVQALFEKTRFVDLREVLLKNKEKFSNKTFLDIESCLSLIEKSVRLTAEGELFNVESNRKLLMDLVLEKTVALVGPGVPHDDFGNEIDAFDTVIRLKFIDRGMLDDRRFHGDRTDVSFIGVVTAVKLQEDNMEKDLKSFKLLLSNPTKFSKIGSTPIYSFNDSDVVFRTPTTSGIRTLNEILKFSPAKLKIFGFDFYTTLTPYSKQITEFYETSSWVFEHPNDFVADGVYFMFARARDFSVHDPVSNFCFAQNLYKAGLFDIEPYGKSILELTPYQYVERLEEMLGDW